MLSKHPTSNSWNKRLPFSSLFHAWGEPDGKLDESNPPKNTVDETVIHPNDGSIKKILIGARHHYKRTHVPRDEESQKNIKLHCYSELRQVGTTCFLPSPCP